MAVLGTPGHGAAQNIQIDDSNGTLRNMSGDCRDFSWPLAAAVAESMGAGDSYEEYTAGLIGSKVSLTAMMNDVANVGSWTVLGTSLGTTRTVQWRPFGDTSDYPDFSAEIVCTGITVTAGLTDITTFTWEGVSTSTVTITTVP